MLDILPNKRTILSNGDIAPRTLILTALWPYNHPFLPYGHVMV